MSGYTQTRAAAAPDSGTASAPPVAANSNYSSAQPANGNAPQRVVILVGGAGDSTLSHGPVSGPFRNAQFSGIGNSQHYFTHDESDKIRGAIDSMAPGTEVVLVGHSWGGQTVAEVAAGLAEAGRQVDLLVTVDPVGSRRSDAGFLAAARRGAREWININAVGSSSFEPSNLIAGLGGAYNDRLRNYADNFIAAPEKHANFLNMLMTPDAAGYTALDAISGRLANQMPRRALP